jgi:hypothetical protein
MDEKEDLRSFPVKVTGMRMGWIIWTEEGNLFLRTILKSENLDLYDIESL